MHRQILPLQLDGWLGSKSIQAGLAPAVVEERRRRLVESGQSGAFHAEPSPLRQ